MKSTTNSPITFLAKGAIVTAVAAVLASSVANADYLQVNSLSIAAGGTLNMSEASEAVAAAALHGLIVQAPDNATHLTNITNIRGWINTGFNGGLWDGVGITSPTVAVDAGVNGVLAVMLYDNTLLNYDDFAGATGLLTPFEQVFVRVTYYGDYDASGVIDATDYGILDAYLGLSANDQGDINADGIIDSSDYGILDAVLGFQPYGDLTSVGSPFAGGGGKSGGIVPEPGSAMLLLSGVVGILGMRRRTKIN